MLGERPVHVPFAPIGRGDRIVLFSAADGSRTADPTPMFAGVAAGGARVRLLVDGGSVGTTVAGATGAFTLTPARPLIDGMHQLIATSTDAAGHRTTVSEVHDFWIDSVAPATPVVTSPSSRATVSSTPDVTGSAEPGSHVEVFVDGRSIGTTMTADTGRFTFLSSSPLAQGKRSGYVVAHDSTGNVSKRSLTRSFAVDVSAPAAPVLSLPADPTISHDTTPTFRGTAAAGATVTIYVDDRPIGVTSADTEGNFTFTAPRAIAATPHVALAIATDRAGSLSPRSNRSSFTIDTERPARPGPVIVRNRPTTGESAEVEFGGSSEPNAFVTIYLDGVQIGAPTADARGRFTFTPARPLQQGSHALVVVATDAGGNVSSPRLVRLTIGDHPAGGRRAHDSAIR